MEIIDVNTNELRKAYLKFNQSLYKNNQNFKGYTIYLLKDFLYKQSEFTHRIKSYPIMVIDNEIKVTAILVIANHTCFISFLEFVNHQKYLSALIKYAEEFAVKNNAKRILIGINGHVSYGAGILTEGFDNPQLFCCNYNLDYYPKLLAGLKFKQQDVTSYLQDFSKIDFSDEVIKEVESKFTFRKLDKANYKKDILIFGDLCHKTLSNTANYYERTAEEMYELIKDMKFILKPDDLTFAMKDGKEVGFLFLHPDYNELVKGNSFKPISLFMQYKLHQGKTEKMIFNTMGVLPEYRKEKIMVGLFANILEYVQTNFKFGVTTFIQSENVSSDTLSKSLSIGVYNRYCIYEKEV